MNPSTTVRDLSSSFSAPSASVKNPGKATCSCAAKDAPRLSTKSAGLNCYPMKSLQVTSNGSATLPAAKTRGASALSSSCPGNACHSCVRRRTTATTIPLPSKMQRPPAATAAAVEQQGHPPASHAKNLSIYPVYFQSLSSSNQAPYMPRYISILDELESVSIHTLSYTNTHTTQRPKFSCLF